MQFLQQDDHAELVEVDEKERIDDGHGAENAAEECHQAEGEPAARRHHPESGVAAPEKGLHEGKRNSVQQEDHEGDRQVGQPRGQDDTVEAPEGGRSADQGCAERLRAVFQ